MKLFKQLLKTYLYFLIIVTITILIYTLLIYNEFISTNVSTIRTTTYILGCILFCFLGFISCKGFKSKGWLKAGLTSSIILIIMIIIRLISNLEINILYFVKVVSYLICSMLGGIFGINIFNRKK